MKVLTGYIAAFILLVLTMSGCSDSQWSNLPDKVSEFITHYYPNEDVSSEGWNDSTTFSVKMSGGEIITFDKSLNWEEVNGLGGLVPQVFLFDELPPALYEYLQETESLSNVYSVDRNSHEYIVELLNSSVIYDIDSGAITVPISGTELMSRLNHSIG